MAGGAEGPAPQRQWTPDSAVPDNQPGGAAARLPAPAAVVRVPEYDPARIIFAVVAALLFAFAGIQMVSMRSIAGDSLAEAFYHAIGFATLGAAALSIAVGLRKS